MRKEKVIAIKNGLNCHKGDTTVSDVMAHLPESCYKLPRNIIIDILNACNNAHQEGKQKEAADARGHLGRDWWEITAN